MLRLERAFVVVLVLSLAACGYGPERTSLRLDSVVAKPGSHVLAVSLEYSRVKDPTGFINTFPNGGIQKLIHREARVYRCNLDDGSIDLVAAVPGFGGIPQPKSVFIQGWQDDSLYFSLFGYGGDAWKGDDHSDERRLFYRVSADGQVEEVSDIPATLESGRNSGPLQSPPFLRWSKGHLDVSIAMDIQVSTAIRLVLLTFDSETGEPHLKMP